MIARDQRMLKLVRHSKGCVAFYDNPPEAAIAQQQVAHTRVAEMLITAIETG
jgi:hypothetical protein